MYPQDVKSVNRRMEKKECGISRAGYLPNIQDKAGLVLGEIEQLDAPLR